MAICHFNRLKMDGALGKQSNRRGGELSIAQLTTDLGSKFRAIIWRKHRIRIVFSLFIQIPNYSHDRDQRGKIETNQNGRSRSSGRRKHVKDSLSARQKQMCRRHRPRRRRCIIAYPTEEDVVDSPRRRFLFRLHSPFPHLNDISCPDVEVFRLRATPIAVVLLRKIARFGLSDAEQRMRMPRMRYAVCALAPKNLIYFHFLGSHFSPLIANATKSCTKHRAFDASPCEKPIPPRPHMVATPSATLMQEYGKVPSAEHKM